MKIDFESITERDMDLVFMQKFSEDQKFLELFLREIGLTNIAIHNRTISHSVSTEDGESDIEVILDTNERKIALLVEDKINAPAMDKQAKRYSVRGEKAVEAGRYDEFHVFIVAPEKYLKNNSEAQKYPHRISYESIKAVLEKPFEIAVMNHALKLSERGYQTIYNKQVTDFWDKLYDFVDENYPGVFNIHGEKGLARSSAPGQWITFICNNQFGMQIKSDRGYVDLEIRNYANKFEQFCKDNMDIIDSNRLFVRTASKSLAIRRYVSSLDFSKPFEEEEPLLREAFDAAKELQDLIKILKIR